MTSDHKPQSIGVNQAAVKDATPVVASVRITDRRLDKLIRLAALEVGTTRSEFMAGASVEKARAALRLQREEDFRAWLDAA